MKLFDYHSSHPCMMYHMLGPILSGLDAVSLGLTQCKYERMANIMSRFTRLRAVRILGVSIDWEKMDFIPSNIEKLRLDYGFKPLYNDYHHIEAFVRTLPKLRSLYIVQRPETWDTDDWVMQSEGFPVNGLDALRLYCAQSGIEFSRIGIMEPNCWCVIL